MMVLAPAMEEEEGDRRRVDHFRGRVLDMYEEKDEDMDIDNRSTKATQVGYACTSKHTQREKSGRGR